MISTHFVGQNVFLRIGNFEFGVKIPYSLNGVEDSGEHLAEMLYTKLKAELEDAFEAGVTYGSYAYWYSDDAIPPTFEEYLAGTHQPSP